MLTAARPVAGAGGFTAGGFTQPAVGYNNQPVAQPGVTAATTAAATPVTHVRQPNRQGCASPMGCLVNVAIGAAICVPVVVVAAVVITST